MRVIRPCRIRVAIPLEVQDTLIGWAYADLDKGLDALATAPDTSVVPNVVITYLSYTHAIMDVVLQVVGLPLDAIGRIDTDKQTPGDVPAVTSWSVSWLPTLIDVLTSLFGDVQALARFFGTVGPTANCVMGGWLLAVGIWTVTEMEEDPEDYNGYTEAAVILPTIPGIAKILIPAVNKTWSDFLVAIPLFALMCFLDDAGNIGAAVCSMGGGL